MNAVHPSISSANALFRAERYQEALMMYREVSRISPDLGRVISHNIQLCERLTKTSSGSRFSENHSSELPDNDPLTLLGRPIAPARSAPIPATEYILGIIDSTKQKDVKLHHLTCALVCAYCSPFQRDLLWYAAALCRRLDTWSDSLLECTEDKLPLATLLAIASDRQQWLLRRDTVRRFLTNRRISDHRAWDLTESAPDEVTADHLSLPKFRHARSVSYKWHHPSVDQADVSKTGLRSSLTLGTILLNEKKFIGLNLLQHYDLCQSWLLVEGACQGYPPRKVSSEGLSLDNCSLQIRIFPDPAGKLKFLQHGWTKATGEDAKSELRNRYISQCDTGALLVVDADEFYIKEHLEQALLKLQDEAISAITLPQVHFWKHTGEFITGEYYDISHTRLYRNFRGMEYRQNHNFPEIGGKFIHHMGHFKYSRTIRKLQNGKHDFLEPCCFHMGFAKDYDDMRDKSDYYINRGEAQTRKITTHSRAAWFKSELPEKCTVRPWGGELPTAINLLSEVRQ